MSAKFPFEHRRLGDPHNFGKITALRSDGKVTKPRNTAWERAFLSGRSPLRQRIDAICRAGGMNLPLPDLQYTALPEGGTTADFVGLQLPTGLSERDVESLGAAIAVTVWFGMTDLSAENFACGTMTNGSQHGAFCALPLEIESVLRPLTALHQTGLVPRTDSARPHITGSTDAGLLPLRPLMIELADSRAPAILVGAFSAMISLLQQNRHDFTPLIAPLMEEPVRIFLRPTDFYRSILARGTAAVRGTIGMLDEEVSQLLRGDIPWFFSLPGTDELFWFDRLETYRPVGITTQGLFPELKKLPTWPLPQHQEDYLPLLQDCVQSLVGFLWKTYPLNATHAGIQIRSDRYGIRISSTGRYQPVAAS